MQRKRPEIIFLPKAELRRNRKAKTIKKRKLVQPPRDLVGKRYYVGAKVIRPVRLQTSANRLELQIITILRIDPYTGKVFAGPTTCLTNPEKFFIIPELKCECRETNA